MDAGAALSPPRDPQWKPRRNRLALAFAVGLHLLAIFWLQQQRPPAVRAEGRRAVSILWLLPAERPRASARVPAPMLTPVPTPVREHAPAAPPLTHPPARAQTARPTRTTPPPRVTPTPAPPPAPTRPAPDPLAAPQPAPPDAATLVRDAATAHDGFALSVAKHQAARIDRELRGGKSGVPLEADTPWARFQRGLEAAHVDRSMSIIEDSYTSPDGVVIYRRRMGGRTTCYRTGSVGLGVAGTRGANEAGSTECPSGVTWHREE